MFDGEEPKPGTLSEKAAAERRRCRDWLLPFMQDNQPKFLTKDELRVAAIRQLNVSKNSFDFADRCYRDNRPSRLVRALAPTAAHQNLAASLSAYSQLRPATPCGYRRCRAMSPIGGKAENICSQRAFRLLTRFGHRPDPSLRPTSAIAQRLVRASYCVIDTPILLTAGVIASIEACDAGVSSGPVRPARRAQPARDRSSAAALL
jgi:hypothetical protein